MTDVDTHTAVYDVAVESGRAAAWHDPDRGVDALARVCARAETTADRARVFGFVTGLAMVWNGVELLDFLTVDTLPTLGTIDDAYNLVEERRQATTAERIASQRRYGGYFPGAGR